MKEDFIQFVWQNALFDTRNLKTVDGKSIEIASPGILNHDSGPDFSGAFIKMEGVTWAGNVEIHMFASEWNDHQHQIDPAYNNVVLHVVYEYDGPIKTKEGVIVPTVELKSRLNPSAVKVYYELNTKQQDIACNSRISSLNPIDWKLCLDRMIVERLEHKSRDFMDLLEKTTNNWEESFYIFLARAFGFKLNAIPFTMLAQSIPYNVYMKNGDRPFVIESILFGQAGFLEDTFLDDYPNMLKREYTHHKYKYGFSALPKSMWKMSKMRPNNFPSIRIAQFSSIMSKQDKLFGLIKSSTSVERIRATFLNIPVHPYWQNHAQFDSSINSRSAQLGQMAVNNLLINAVVPALYAYAKVNDDSTYVEKSLNILESIPAENNRITRKWLSLGMDISSSKESQGAIHLYNEKCARKKCVSCSIGQKWILKNDKQNKCHI